MSTLDILMAAAGEEEMRGESLFAVPGTYQFIVPAGVSRISSVCVGGGGGGVGDAYGAR
jgi:hypothetical protein